MTITAKVEATVAHYYSLRHLLFLRYDAEKIYEGTERYAIPTLFDRLNETLNILTYDNSSINIYNNKMYTYVLLDWRIDVWKPIMITVERRGTLHARKLSVNAVAFNKAKDADLYKCNANVNADVDVDVDVDDDVGVGVGVDCAGTGKREINGLGPPAISECFSTRYSFQRTLPTTTNQHSALRTSCLSF